MTNKAPSVAKSKPQSKCKKCNCKNSKCLKLYCECLANGEYCGPDCGCQTCYNTSQFESARSQAISQIVEKNPLAFNAAEQTVQRHKSNESYLNKSARHKGCTCKRSGCNKKYCECFAYGIPCGDACRCENCKNCNGTKKFDRDECATSCEVKTEVESNSQSIEEESTDSTSKFSISREKKRKELVPQSLGFKADTLQSLGLFQPKVLPKNISLLERLNSFDKENVVKN